jgi:adenylate cyclase
MSEYVSIRRSLISRLVLLVLITTGALVAIAAIAGARAGDDVAREFVESEALAVLDLTEDFFDLVELRVMVVRDWIALGRIKATDFEELNSLFLPVIEYTTGLSSLMISDLSGAEYMVLRDPADYDIITNRFVDPGPPGLPFRSRVWNRATNESVTTLEDPGYDTRTRRWFRGAVEAGGELDWTPPTIFYVTRDPGMTASISVDPPGDLPTHVVAFDVLLLDISMFTANRNVGDNGAAFVMVEDYEGHLRVVGMPRRSGDLNLSDVRDIFLELSADQTGVDEDPRLPLPEDFDFPPMKASLETWIELGRPDASFKFDQRGDDWWAHVDQLELGKQRLLIGVVVPESDFLSEATKDVIIISLVGVLGIILALVMAVRMSRSYSVPLESLVESSRRIRELDLGESQPVETRIQEVHTLAEEQDVMRVTLDAFARYMPVTLVRELLRRKEAAVIGGENRVITVMFTDVEGYTTVSEQLSPEEIAEHMSEYFEVLLETVQRHGGEVIQMMGDGIMAFWGAPRLDEDQALNAVQAALDFRAQLVRLNRQWQERGKLPLPTRFGINTGRVMVGNMGSHSRLTYAALGDDVNLASRIEGINKYYGTRLMVSGETKTRAGDSIEWRHVDTVRVKGKSQPIELFEALGRAGTVDSSTISLRDRFEQALTHFQRADFEQAASILDTVLKDHEDGPSIRLRSLAAEYIAHPPSADWDGVTNFDVK